MRLEDELVEIGRANNVRVSGSRGGSVGLNRAPLSPAELERQRDGHIAYRERQRVDGEAGVSTMAVVNAERSMAVIEGLDRATHRVLRGACAGELVRQFGRDGSGKIKVDIVAGPRKGRIMIVNQRYLEEIRREVPSNE